MSKILKKIKSNNKGDTLAIVLVGIVLLAMLGTVILSITSVNFKMKLSEMQSKKNFYYCEAALDEIYAGIGSDVSAAMENAYTKALTTLVTRTGTTYTTVSNTDCTKTFKDTFIGDMKAKYYAGNIPNIINLMQTSFLKTSTTYPGVTVTVESIDSIDDSVEGQITLKGLKVSSKTNSGYYANIKTDLIIKTPNVNLSFADSGSRDYGELFEYALVAQGNRIVNTANGTNWLKHASITVSGNGTVNIGGNVYAGTNYDGTSYVMEKLNESAHTKDDLPTTERKDSINVGGGTLNISAGNVVAAGSVVTGKYANDGGASVVKQNNTVLNLTGSATKSLNFWTGNLEVEGNTDKVNVDGNCVVSDDLEINGDHDTVDIKGSYYGYGYDGTIDTAAGTAVENSSNENGNNAAVTVGDKFEHEKRSAVIINGKDSNLQLTGDDKQLIIAGRSYIDLTGRAAVDSNNATYMTGESISFRGNQEIYMADESELGNSISANPVPYTSSMFNASGIFKYADFGIDSNSVIAKYFGGTNIYFYHYEKNPIAQTDYFKNKYQSTIAVRNTIQNNANKLAINKVKVGDGTSMYTVGTAMQVDGGNVEQNRGFVLPTGSNDGRIDENMFGKLIEDFKCRFKLLNTSMQDLGHDTLGHETIDSTTEIRAQSPFEFYVDSVFMGGSSTNKSEQNIQRMGDSELASKNIEKFTDAELNSIGVTNRDSVNIGYQICNMPTTIGNAGGEVKQVEIDQGVVVSTGNIRITKDFKGLIICQGDIIIDAPAGRNITIESDKETATLIADKCQEVAKALAGYVPGTVTTNPDAVVDLKDISYTNVISYDNWQKNAD